VGESNSLIFLGRIAAPAPFGILSSERTFQRGRIDLGGAAQLSSKFGARAKAWSVCARNHRRRRQVSDQAAGPSALSPITPAPSVTSQAKAAQD